MGLGLSLDRGRVLKTSNSISDLDFDFAEWVKVVLFRSRVRSRFLVLSDDIWKLC